MGSDWGGLPGALVEAVARLVSQKTQLHMCAVNRHWRHALTHSTALWAKASVDLTWDWLGGESRSGRTQLVASHIAYLGSRAAGIREVDLKLDGEEQWNEAAFMLGMLRGSLRRLSIDASGAAEEEAELRPDAAAWLYSLRHLTSLELTHALEGLGAGVAALTSLRELVVRREEGMEMVCGVPEEVSALRCLTRLELMRCVEGALPAGLGTLGRLRVLSLQGSELDGFEASITQALTRLTRLEELHLSCCHLGDVPGAALGALHQLTALHLAEAFTASWSGGEWDARLACLSSLTRLVLLDLSGNELPRIPSSVTGLTSLLTLNMGLNPVTDGGILCGPYLLHLAHLDLRAACVAELPQHLTTAQQLTFLGLSCCHDLLLDEPLATNVLGRMVSLQTLTICGQQLHSVDSARMMLRLGRMLPGLQVTSPHGEDEEGDEDEDEDDWDEGEEEGSEWESDFEGSDEGSETSSGEGGSEAEGSGSEGEEGESESEWEEYQEGEEGGGAGESDGPPGLEDAAWNE